VLVELRYETIVVEDGKLHIFRDVYDRGTNTEENLRAVLEANNVRLEDLSAEERTQISNALAQLSGKSAVRTGSLSASPSPAASPFLVDKKSTGAKTPRTSKNQKAAAKRGLHRRPTPNAPRALSAPLIGR
jgi:hypothetical protein